MFADFLVMPANMPHVIQADIEHASGKKVLSMIEVTLAEVSQQGHRHVGLLGLGIPQVYLSPLQEKGVCCSIGCVERNMEMLARWEPWGRSSLSFDLENNKRLELDALNGAVVRSGHGEGPQDGWKPTGRCARCMKAKTV